MPLNNNKWAILGHYAVSNCGVIMALGRDYINRWGSTSYRKPKILAQSNDQDGYKLTTMTMLGWNKNNQYRVHRLVAHCWIGKCPDGLEVNHIDGVKYNNHYKNLEYVTSKRNKIHAVEMGLIGTGMDHHHTKPIKISKGCIEKMLHGVKEIEAMGFHAPSVHRAARGDRKGYKGWGVEYV
jgi:hypothetical protein